jgi:hypothetical protein
VADPVGRFLIAFDDTTLEPSPTWTRIDSHPHLVTSYTIDRGRQYELDRTDTGRATVTIADKDGILDPTNPGGPFWDTGTGKTKIRPLLQATLGRYNPVTDTWFTRYRGFIEEMTYTFDPSQRVNRLELTLVDIFELLSAVEMVPGGPWPADSMVDAIQGVWGDEPPPKSVGQIFFDNALVGDRIRQVITNAFGATTTAAFAVIFSGNVLLYEATYSPGQSAMDVVQEAADAEWPGVSNVYTDRLGRLVFHGRLAKFDPAGVLAGPGVSDLWDWHHLFAGDGTAVNANPSTTAHVRQFAFNYGLSKIINSATATPVNIQDEDVAGQTVTDPDSIAQYGIRSWSAQNLLTKTGILDSSTDLDECRNFCFFYVGNYATPQNRVTLCGFRTMSPDQVGAGATWHLLSAVDISDRVDITVGSPGGGGFDAVGYYVEGVHEQVQPLGELYDDVTLTLDLSPLTYYELNPFPVE